MKKFTTFMLLVSILIWVPPVYAKDAFTYNYSSFVGEWNKVDPDGLNGDVLLNIYKVSDNNRICFSLDGGDVMEKTIVNNKVTWTEIWYDGIMGLTLTFYDDHIHLQYSRYSHEWYNEIVFVSHTAKPQKFKICQVFLNEKEIMFDQPSIIIDGRALVPVRGLVESMGGLVFWDEATKTVMLLLNNNFIQLTIGSKIAYLNYEMKILDVAPRIIGDRTLMPVRFIAEGFGFYVNWNNDTETVSIIK